MFTGASQFALVGVVGAGGSALAGALTALLLGSRNALYGLRLAPLLRVRGARRAAAAQLVIDESTAMALARGRAGFGRRASPSSRAGTPARWPGALGGAARSRIRARSASTRRGPAAFVALLAPRLDGRAARSPGARRRASWPSSPRPHADRRAGPIAACIALAARR